GRTNRPAASFLGFGGEFLEMRRNTAAPDSGDETTAANDGDWRARRRRAQPPSAAAVRTPPLAAAVFLKCQSAFPGISFFNARTAASHVGGHVICRTIRSAESFQAMRRCSSSPSPESRGSCKASHAGGDMRIHISSLVVGALCVAGTAMAQVDSVRRTSTSRIPISKGETLRIDTVTVYRTDTVTRTVTRHTRDTVRVVRVDTVKTAAGVVPLRIREIGGFFIGLSTGPAIP